MFFLLFKGFWLACYLLDCLVVEGTDYPECANIERFNTFVASQKSCARYIFCDGENSFEGECLGDNYFDEVKGNCDDRSVVFCRIEHNGSFNNDNDVASNSGSHDNNVDNEHNFSSVGNYSNEEEDTDSQEEVEEEENSATIVSEHEYQPSLNEVTNNPPEVIYPTILPNSGLPGLVNTVPIPDLQIDFLQTPHCAATLGQVKLMNLPNPTSCSSYFTCYTGMAIPMICGRDQYFNTFNGKCEPKERVQCLLNRPISLQCIKGIYDFMPHPRNCEYYYFCSNGFLMIFQCPSKYNWDYQRKTCVHQAQSNCFSSSVRQEMLLP